MKSTSTKVLAVAACLFAGAMAVPGFARTARADVVHHASTPEESEWRGRGAFLRGAGEYLVDKARAAEIWEQAIAMRISNLREEADRKYELRRQYLRRSAEKRRPALSAEAYRRWHGKPKPVPLSAQQWDEATGKLYWPTALRSEQFAELRSDLEGKFAERSAHGAHARHQFQHEVRQSTRRLRELLNKQAKHLDAATWIEGKRFIAALEHEAGQEARTKLAISSQR